MMIGRYRGESSQLKLFVRLCNRGNKILPLSLQLRKILTNLPGLSVQIERWRNDVLVLAGFLGTVRLQCKEESSSEEWYLVWCELVCWLVVFNTGTPSVNKEQLCRELISLSHIWWPLISQFPHLSPAPSGSHQTC